MTRYAGMDSIGATGDITNAKEAGKTIGSYLKKYQFNLDFVPVCDVNTNSSNTVIGNRSFGSDPDLVADMVSAEIKGFHESDMMTCAKHFPGHGDTVGDSHKGYVSALKTWDEIVECEMIPFQAVIKADTDMIMVAHITLPNAMGDGLPASLSKEMVTGKLRQELGYEGVVITDALNMGAIANAYDSETSAVLAIQAGVDILLMPKDYVAAFLGVQTAVREGKISEDRIDESVLRILRLKSKYGMLEK